MHPITASIDLLRKYNIPGPRYTSYPPATHFSEGFDPSGREAEGTPPLSLYFHLPFCSRQCLYCGCTNIVTADTSKSAEYLGYLERELRLRARRVAAGSRVVQLQLGGGTPTFFQPSEIARLGALVRENFPMAGSVEAGVEIDPRSLTPEKVQALREAGFNRASLGVQDTDPRVQKAIGRIQPLELVATANRWLRESGMESVNIDLVYGLPAQTVESFSRTLEEAIALDPDRLAVYSYAHIPWIKPFQKHLEGLLPDAETKLRLLRTAIETLTGAGYAYIGMDHFAKPGDSLARALRDGTLQRNFQGYSTHKGVELHGFGMSAISHAGGCYFQNQKALDGYYAALDAGRLPIARGYAMTADDRVRYHAIMRIMCDLFVDYDRLSDELGIDFRAYFRAEIDSLGDLEADGLVRREAGGLRVTPLGRLFVRVVAMRFDAYLRNERRAGRYSQTV